MNRTELALLACEGMTDEDLMQRGKHGFPKMIIRKRMYADATRGLAKKCEELVNELEVAKATIKTLESFNMPVTDMTQANDIINGLFKH